MQQAASQTCLPFSNPCQCIEGDVRDGIHIMWVTMNDGQDTSDTDILNHIVPLLPQGGDNSNYDR